MARNRGARRTGARANEPKKIATALGRDADEGYPSFSLRYVDKNGSWSWNGVSSQDKARILDFMGDMCVLSWAEIAQQRDNRGKKHHYQEAQSIATSAQGRLTGLEDEVDYLFRFRLGSRERLWGIRKYGVFYVLWWDPEHTVYPTEPNNT